MSEQVSRASVGLRSERGPVLLGVMLGTGLVAIDSTILATAVPALVADLGGFSQFPWLFSIYLLASAVVTPVCGKLADLVGRRTVVLAGIGVFVLGSVLCGLAWSMPALIAFRAVQGLGAGAVQPMTMTIVGDLYSVAERAKVQGYVASVWAASSVVGPTLGGLFVDLLDWRWIFFVNVPLGALAAWMLARNLREPARTGDRRIDWAGAALLTAGASLLILGLLSGGVQWEWVSAPSLLSLGGGVAALLALWRVERRAAEPILPGWAFTRRVLNGTYLSNVGVGVLLIGLTSYLPVFSQEVLGTSALVAGFALAALTLGWPIAAANAARLYLRVGFRDTGLVGSVLALAGTASMLVLDVDSSVWQVAAGCFGVGLGLGLIAAPTLIAAQSTVGWEQRGVVTGVTTFARSMGSALGLAVFGAVVNARVGTAVGGHGGGASDVPPELLAAGVHDVLLVSTGVALAMLVALLVLPRRIDTAGPPAQVQ
ncbi:MDR family MFS transporter [Desertihabitans brevis]|nr:MDR family MFS transporter [Desertihabitans brevis]